MKTYAQSKNNKKTKKQSVRQPKRRPRGVNPEEFRQIMDRLELIKQEMKKQEEIFELRMKSLKLEEEYLWKMVKPKKR